MKERWGVSNRMAVGSTSAGVRIDRRVLVGLCLMSAVLLMEMLAWTYTPAQEGWRDGTLHAQRDR